MARVAITKNFYLDEFLKSKTAEEKGIKNTPNSVHILNLKYLVTKILQPVRTHFNKAVHVHSGYRSPALNEAIGGSRSSQHCSGEAADFEIFGIPNKDVAEWIADNLEYDQIILEFYNPKDGPNSGWIHVSMKRIGKNRKKKLVAYKDGTKTRYVAVKNFEKV
jgi:hypothetical protein